MRYRVTELPKAEADIRDIANWLARRSLDGAAAWLDAYDEIVARLERNPDSFGVANENRDCDFDYDICQAFFKTIRGRAYRVLFFVAGDTVFILRVRGPGQAPLMSDELA